MSAEMIVALAIGVLIVLLLIRVPVALALAGAGTVGTALYLDADTATSTLGSTPFSAVADYTLLVVPFFIAMGVYARNAGIAEGVFALLNRKLRRVPASVPLATILACALFGAISGSSIAAVATLGPISMHEMERAGYSQRLASGVVAVAGTLGVLIPPSIPLILYGIVTGESIERLLIAGIIPGILTALVYGVVTFGLVRRTMRQGSSESVRQTAGVGAKDHGGSVAHTGSAPAADLPPAEPARNRQLIALGQLTLIVVVVLGGLYGGIFTITESAGIGALMTLVMLFAGARTHGMRTIVARFGDSVREIVSVTSMIMLLFVGASIFTYFLVVSGVPASVVGTVSDLQWPPLVVLAMILFLAIALGTFLDSVSIILIVGVLAHGIVVDGLGYDGIWFAILLLKTIEIGLVTPPVGMNCYVLAGTVPNLRVETVFRGVVPFILADILVIGVLIAVPALAIWLPSHM